MTLMTSRMTFSSLARRSPSTAEPVQFSSLSHTGVCLCSAQWQVLPLLVPFGIPSCSPAPAQHWAPLLPPPSQPHTSPFSPLTASWEAGEQEPAFLCRNTFLFIYVSLLPTEILPITENCMKLFA